MPKLVDADQRRIELADAAAHVIARDGIDNLSLRVVAAEAGWTTGALVHYFANKRELLAFTLQTSLDRRRSRTTERERLAPLDALRATLFDALPTTPATKLHWIVTLAFAAQASADAELAAIQRDAYREFRSTVASLCARADDERVDPNQEAEHLIALVDGIALQALFDPELWTAERQTRALDEGLERM
jgi:AcrR family transcriptional regulator